MKRHHLYALLGLSVALSAQVMAQTPPPVPAPPVMGPAQASTHSAIEQSNSNPFKPKEVAPSPPSGASGGQPLPAPPMPMPMPPQAPMPGANGEAPKRLGTLNGVTAYRGADTSYQFFPGAAQ